MRLAPPGPRWSLLLALLTACAGPIAAGAASASSPGSSPGTSPEIRLTPDGAIDVTGLPAATLARLRATPRTLETWRRDLAVFPGSSAPRDGAPAPGLPPMLGTYAVTGRTVRFIPRFPLIPGRPYFVACTLGPQPLTATLALPAPDLEPTTVVAAIHPSTTEVPENLLRLYLQFSAPMSRGDAFRHVHLLDAQGREVEAPFVAPQAELWSPDSTRLTLLFDPGRLKRGVLPHDTEGPPLHAGARYTLVVDRDLEDARGARLREEFRHPFRALPADRTRPRTEDWTLTAPAGPKEPLALAFPEPLDHALLQHLLTVEDPQGAPLAGEVEVAADARGWSFRPERPWAPGRYALAVDTGLEDLAGNSLRQLFDVERVGRETAGNEMEGDTLGGDGPGVVRLGFVVR